MGTMTPEELRDIKADDLHSDAIREMELDELAFLHEAGEHAEKPLVSECPDCERDFLDAVADHAWMSLAVRTNSANPYAPDPSWRERDGYVVAPLVNRGTLDAD